MRRVLSPPASFFWLPSASAAATLPSLFMKAKEQFRLAELCRVARDPRQAPGRRASFPATRPHRVAAGAGARLLPGRLPGGPRPGRRGAREFEIYLAYQPNAVARSVALSPPRHRGARGGPQGRARSEPPADAGRRRPARSPPSYRAFSPGHHGLRRRGRDLGRRPRALPADRPAAGRLRAPLRPRLPLGVHHGVLAGARPPPGDARERVPRRVRAPRGLRRRCGSARTRPAEA